MTGDAAVPLSGAARGISATLVARVLDTCATWGFFALASQALTVSDFGRLAVALAWAQLGALVARRGLDQALLVSTAAGPVTRFALRQVIASGSLVTVVMAAAAIVVHSADVVVLALAIPLIASAQLAIGALRADACVARAAVAEGMAQPISAVAMGAVVAAATPTVAGFALAYAVSWLAPLALALRLDWRSVAIDDDASRDLLATGRAMLGVALMAQLAGTADVILLGLLASTADAARYAVPQKITAVFLLLHSAVAAASGPFVRSAVARPAALVAYHRMAVRWSVTLALPLLVVAVGSPGFILRVFGEEYARESTWPLVVLSMAALTYLLTGPIGTLLLCLGAAARLFRVTTLHAACVLVGVAALSTFGPIGAAIGLLLGNVLGRALFFVALRQHLRFGWDAATVHLLGGGVAGIAVVRLLSPRTDDVFALAIGLAVAGTLATLVLLRAGDLHFVRAEFRQLIVAASARSTSR